MTTALENPFPVQAVTTFGARAPAFADLRYVRDVQNVLTGYFGDYPGQAQALVLSGGHGTGKTFLLNWLSEWCASRRTLTPRVLYAKVVGPNLVDAYRQLVGNLTRMGLILIVRAALRAQGQAQTRMAKATVGESERIGKEQSLESAFETKVLDPNELYRDLRATLEATLNSVDASPRAAVARSVAAAVSLLEHGQFGDAAFAWLRGDTADLPDEALRTPLFGANETEAAQVAIDALETLAVLFHAADTPLVIMLDEMENFVAPGQAATASGIIKKLGEQLGARSAALIMAGTRMAWEPMPRDFWPRMHARRALPVGNLDLAEAGILLEAYLDERPGFGEATVRRIHELSSGNTREILQIAHHAFELNEGELSAVSPERALAAAERAGSLYDRADLARQMLAEVTEEIGGTVWPSGKSEGLESWSVVGKNGARAVVALAVARDARSEAELARQTGYLRRHLAQETPSPALAIVTVGYSSERVQGQLGSAYEHVIVFQEPSFKESLRVALGAALARAPEVAPPASAALEEKLAQMERALAQIAAERAHSDEMLGERLAERTFVAAAPARELAESRTRHELMEGLDRLSDALTERDLQEERRIMRRLLIDNEAHIGNRDFDALGSLYFEALDAARAATKALLVTPAGTVEQDVEERRIAELGKLRLELLSHLRRKEGGLLFGLASSRLNLAGLACLVGAATYLYLDLMTRRMTIFADGDRLLILAGASVFVATLLFFYMDLMNRPEMRFARYRRRLAAISS